MTSLFWVFLSIAMASPSTLFEADSQKALERARKEKKPLLIDFYGIWCPPCNQLDETVFSHPTFIEKAKAFQLLKVDADHPHSWSLKSRYRVGGYPTILFTDSEGSEISRIVGYRAPEDFFRQMDLALKQKSRDWKRACQSNDVDELWRCATVCREREDHRCAERALNKLKGKLEKGTGRLEMARGYFVERAATPELKKHGFESLLKEFPESPLALVWSIELLDLNKAVAPGNGPSPALFEAVLANYSKMLADPSRGEIGIVDTDLSALRAELLGRLGRTDEAKAAWKETADLLAKKAAALPVDVPRRGFVIEQIACLESAGDFDAALKMANEYRGKYPDEFTFHFQAASMLHRSKKFNESLPIAQKAYEHGYGDNRIRAGILLIKLYSTVPDKVEAKKVYDSLKAEKRPSKDQKVRTHRFLKALDEAWQAVG